VLIDEPTTTDMRVNHIPTLVFVALFGLLCAARPLIATKPSGRVGGQNDDKGSQSAASGDFGNLARYRNENAKLRPPNPGEKRVVFLGDSITAAWRLHRYFPGSPYVNRGIRGQTTSQMLERFQQDVIDLRPKLVIVLAGTNDIAGNTGPTRNEDIEANYVSMAERARANDVRIVFSSVLPVNSYTDKSKNRNARHSPERIVALNQWLRDYCNKNSLTYLNYFEVMVDEKGSLKKELSDDGLHPNPAGYEIMAPLAEAAITAALK